MVSSTFTCGIDVKHLGRVGYISDLFRLVTNMFCFS